MKRKLLFAAAFASMFATQAFSQSKYTDADLVWQDEFNTGSTINLKDWSYEPHEPGWVNNELQSYGTDTKNTYIKDGNLVIQPIRIENKDGSYSYTSGRINTQGKKFFKYGRMEARIKFPKGQGFLPAFWMMPNDESFYGQWPKCGEIDIAEVLGSKTDTLYGTIHFGEPHSEKQGQYVDSANDFHNDFHVMAVEWEPGEIRYYCDGKLYKTINDWFTKKIGFGEVTYPAPFDQPFYIILNVAVGGNWPGNPTDDTEFGENAQMVVDYVRVYQKKSYDENVKKPEGEKIDISKFTDASGNLVKPTSSAWGFLTAGSGAGSLNVSNGNVTISSTDAGALEYSVQVVHPNIPMEQGKMYKYSFDAYADEERTMITGITAPNANYVRKFGDVKVELSTTPKHFEYDFAVLDGSDSACRLEYNLGAQDSIATVHVSNIRLEQTGDVDFSKIKPTALPDGNFVHNGQFQEGEGRLANWTINTYEGATASVSNDNGRRELEIVTPKKNKNNVSVTQKGLTLPSDKTFKLEFDVRSTKGGKVEVTLGKFKQTAKVSKKTTHCEMVFNSENYGDNGADLTFNVNTNGDTVYLDNVSIKQNILILNGDFAEGMASYETYVHDAARASGTVVDAAGNNCFEMTIDDTGNTDWFIQLKQNNVSLKQGKSYVLSFDAKCDISREIMIALQRDGSKDNDWDPYSGNPKFTLKSDFQHFEVPFTMNRSSDDRVILCVSMGAINGKQIKEKHRVTLDNFVLIMK